MKFNDFQVFVTILFSWLFGCILGLWRSTPYITDREASLLIALTIVLAMVLTLQRHQQNAVLDYLSRNVLAVQNKALLDVQENHRKRIATLKLVHNQTMREAQDEIRRLQARFDRLNGEYDWIADMYQDQMRANKEQDDRIAYLEKKLSEFGQLGATGAAPFSAPASQISFAKPPRRARNAMGASSPLAQEPMVQAGDGEEE